MGDRLRFYIRRIRERLWVRPFTMGRRRWRDAPPAPRCFATGIKVIDVLLLVDNIFRFIQAGMEISGLMGQMPSRLGYQPTLGTELSQLEERIANTDTGAITSIQAVYVPADDFTDPASIRGRWRC